MDSPKAGEPSPGPDGRRRDTQTKVTEYAAAGIPEYWIIDPETESITINHLANSPGYSLGLKPRT